jgi:hypothetical protein
VSVNVVPPGAVDAGLRLEMAGAEDNACVTVICSPRTAMCAVREEVDVFAVNEKLTTPFVMVPIVSQLWSLEGANTPVRDAVEGSTGSSESVPAEEGSVKLAGPTKA